MLMSREEITIKSDSDWNSSYRIVAVVGTVTVAYFV